MMNATELADYLVRKGMPFREAHDTVGKLVIRAIELEVELQELPLDELKAVSNLIEDDIFDSLSLNATLASKSQTGGTAPEQVKKALALARVSLSNW
jgi:argininosuccinate lyase